MSFSPLSRTRLVPARSAGVSVAVALVALLSACQTAPAPKGLAHASASVDVEDAPDPATSIGEEAIHFNRFQAQSFEGYGAGKPPADASGSFQAQAYARAEARRAALRALANQIVDFGHEGKPTLVTILGDADDWREVLEASLEQRAQIEYRTQDGIEMARARIRGDSIFRGPAPPGSAGSKTEDLHENELELIARRRKAEELATKAARDFLYEDLVEFGGRSSLFGFRQGPSATFKKALREELDLQPPTSVEFTDDGRCVVLMQYDRAALERLDY